MGHNVNTVGHGRWYRPAWLMGEAEVMHSAMFRDILRSFCLKAMKVPELGATLMQRSA